MEACNKSMNEAMGITTSLCKIIWGLMPRNSYRQNSPYGYKKSVSCIKGAVALEKELTEPTLSNFYNLYIQ